MNHWLFTEEHEAFREEVRKVVQAEIEPHVEDWERAGGFPRELFGTLSERGYLGLKFPEEYGGRNDLIRTAIFAEELSRCGSGGVTAGIGAHTGIALTPVASFGDDSQKQGYLMPGIAGEKIAALGITEPHSGSDVASIATTARREGDHYVLDGSKTYITNGVRADFTVVGAKTDPEAGHRGISLFIVDTDSPGYSVEKSLDKLGWRSSDTGLLRFDGVRVPAENLLGEEGQGFYYAMQNFQWERVMLALTSIGLAEAALYSALEYAGAREQFGRPIGKFQALRHKMADAATKLEKSRHLAYYALYLHASGQEALREVSMAKALAGEMVREVTDEVVQLFGGNGYSMDYPAQRYWRDARIQSIGGGTTEIMNEIVSKEIGVQQTA